MHFILLPYLVVAAIVASVVSNYQTANAQTLTVQSLNLHGYHPMGELPRWAELRDGSFQKLNPGVFYFEPNEFERGHTRRLNILARDFAVIGPDVIFLQEVAAGRPEQRKDCDAFYRDSLGEQPGANSALRLWARLQSSGYAVGLACRGNVGWWTDPSIFHQFRVRKGAAPTGPVVFDFDSNPYPNGILVEGLAILVKRPWILREQRTVQVPAPDYRGQNIVQVAVLQNPTVNGYVLAVNVHAGHFVAHFEQSLAIREIIFSVVSKLHNYGELRGLIVGGDFNATLFRPISRAPEISTVAWEVAVDGEFDFGLHANHFTELETLLYRMNAALPDSAYDKIKDPVEASLRIKAGVARFQRMQERIASMPEQPYRLREAIDDARRLRKCATIPQFNGACAYPENIDHLFYDPTRLTLEKSSIVYSNHSRANINGLSDHPSSLARFLIKNQR